MKKVILTVAAIFAFGFANAQDKKESTGTGEGFANGDVFISGSVGFGTTTQDEYKSSNFEIAPSIGFFVTDNIALGARLGFSSNKSEDGSPAVELTDMSTLEAGVFARYYATPSSNFSVFGNLGFDYFSSTNNLADPEVKNSGFDIALSPGVSYFLNSNFALEASFGRLGYRTEKADTDGAEAENSFGLELDLTSISLGLVYKF